MSGVIWLAYEHPIITLLFAWAVVWSVTSVIRAARGLPAAPFVSLKVTESPKDKVP